MNNKIASINIPNSMETIGHNAFANNHLTSLIFEEDSNLQEIGM